MAKPGSAGKDGGLFVNCLKPSIAMFRKAKFAAPYAQTFLVLAGSVLAVGGVVHYVCRKVVMK